MCDWGSYFFFTFTLAYAIDSCKFNTQAFDGWHLMTRFSRHRQHLRDAHRYVRRQTAHIIRIRDLSTQLGLGQRIRGDRCGRVLRRAVREQSVHHPFHALRQAHPGILRTHLACKNAQENDHTGHDSLKVE